jgi:hypothetical protein
MKRINDLIVWGQSNPKNFILYALLSATITLLVRFLTLSFFSNIPPIFVKLVTVATLSSLLSIIVFYVKFYHIDKVKSILFPIVDIDRILSNTEKFSYIKEVAKKENPDLKFWVIYLYFPIILLFYYLVNSHIEIPSGIMFAFMFWLICYTSYIMKLRLAFMYADIPLDKIPVPSLFTAKRWQFYYFIRTGTNTILRGSGVGGGSVIQRTAEYMYSPEFQAKAKAMTTTFVLSSMIFGAGIAGESGACSIMNYTTPSYMIISRIVRGCFAVRPITKERFREIDWAIPDDQLSTFIIPGTGRLDDKAISKAYLKMKAWENEYAITGAEMPVLIGPYQNKPNTSIPVESKESSVDTLLSFD